MPNNAGLYSTQYVNSAIIRLTCSQIPLYSMPENLITILARSTGFTHECFLCIARCPIPLRLNERNSFLKQSSYLFRKQRGRKKILIRSITFVKCYLFLIFFIKKVPSKRLFFNKKAAHKVKFWTSLHSSKFIFPSSIDCASRRRRNAST